MSEGVKIKRGELPAELTEKEADRYLAQEDQRLITRALRFVELANAAVGVDGDFYLRGEGGGCSFGAYVPPSSVSEIVKRFGRFGDRLDIHSYLMAEDDGSQPHGLVFGSIERPYDSKADDFKARAEEIANHFRSIGILADVWQRSVNDEEDDDLEEDSQQKRKRKSKLPQEHYAVVWAAVVDTAASEDRREMGGLYDLCDFNFETQSDVNVGLSPREIMSLIGYDQDLGDLIDRITLPKERLKHLSEIWNKVGRSINLFQRLMPPANDEDRRVKFLVPGLIPRGGITLLAGSQEAGKSTLLHELAVAVGGAHDSWLGQPVENSGMCVYLAGEDSWEMLSERQQALDPEGRAANSVIPYPSDSRDLATILTEVRQIPELALLIVDPCRKYIAGDEDSSDGVNRFFTELEDIAKEKGCAVVVVQHLGKNARPRSLADVRAAVRGSGVFLDRPRVMIAMLRRGDRTVIGVTKNNLPPSCDMVMEAREFRREAATLRHVLDDDRSPRARSRERDEASAGAGAQAFHEQVFAELRVALERGARVTRTGRHELYQLVRNRLQGATLRKVRAAVQSLIDAGRVRVLEDGALALADEPTGGAIAVAAA